MSEIKEIKSLGCEYEVPTRNEVIAIIKFLICKL
jgi:hypothetical protein